MVHFEVEFTIISGNAGAKDIVQEGENDFIRNWGYCFIVVFMAIFIQGLLENTQSGPPPVIVLFTIWSVMTILWHLDTKANIYKIKTVINQPS